MSFSNIIYQAKSLIQYYCSAKSIYQIHSPELYDLCINALDGEKVYYIQNQIEFKRSQLERSKESISFVELGAGTQSSTRQISEIAGSSLSSPWQCRIMFNLIDYYRPKHILEIGTSLGISTAYLAAANKNAQVIGLEGNPSSADKASSLLRDLQLRNAKVITGKFEDQLKPACDLLKTVDFAFIDGNHRKAPTLEYFKILLDYSHDQSILIFDDIHWSSDMEAAWQEIIAHPRVTYSLDLFYFGIVFLDPKFLSKGHISFIDSRYKPWQKYFSE
jgi:predicted O-methyltransferase YrrM